MTPVATRIAFAALGLLALTGFGLVDANFDANSPWFFIGLATLVVSCIGVNAVMREAHTRTLNEEFDAGYRVGYRAGRRTLLSIARPGITDPIPLRARRAQKDVKTNGRPAWPDSEDSRRGSTRLQ
jgi:hypothetical protein